MWSRKAGRRILRLATLMAMLLTTHPGTAKAQDAGDRAALQALQDSLRGVTDRPRLHALEDRTIAEARQNRDNPMLHLRLGLIGLRLAELGSRSHSDHAQAEFEWAQELRPDWPWPRYGLGLVLAQRPDRAGKYGGGLVAMLGLDERTQASQAYREAVRADSAFVDALVGLSEVTRDRRSAADDRETLRALRSLGPRYATPDLLLTWALRERRKGSHDSALTVLARLRDTLGLTPHLLLEIARTVPLVSATRAAALQMPAADSAYFLGAAAGDSLVQQMYRDDLRPIVTDSLLAEFDARTGAARVAWLRAFWQERDALELRAPGERLAEHFRRWASAMSQYRLQPGIRRYAIEVEAAPSSEARDLDDRGWVLLRHGTPLNRLPYPMFAEYGPVRPGMVSAAMHVYYDARGNRVVEPPLPFYRPPRSSGGHSYGNETWLYQQPDGDLVLHFAAHHDPFDYRLQRTVFTLSTQFADYVIRGSTIRGALTDNPLGDGVRVADEVARGRRDNHLATTTDSWTRVYEHPINAKPHWFVLGDSAGQPLLHLVYALDATAVRAESLSRVPVTLRAAFVGPHGNLLARVDTVHLIPRPSPTPRAVSFRMQAVLPPGQVLTRLAGELTRARGAMHRSDTLILPVVDGSELALSDLVLGRAGHSNVWRTPEGQVVPMDPRDLPYLASDTLDLYAEVYGVRPTEQYQVSLTLRREVGGLRRLFGGGGPAIVIRQPLQFGGAKGRFSRAITLAGIEPGKYRMTLVVEGGGMRLERSRGVEVLGQDQ